MNQLNNSSNSTWQSQARQRVEMVATLLIFLVGTTLNGLVIWALVPHRCRQRRDMREFGRVSGSFRIYVLNLAVADLVLLLRTPLMIAFLSHGGWPYSLTMCSFTMSLRGLGLYASAFLLCAMALERCLCLLKPFWIRLHRPTWVVPVTCCGVWLLAMALSAPYLLSAVLVKYQGKVRCQESGEYKMWLFVTETAAGFVLPLLLFVGSNLAILLNVPQADPTISASSSPVLARRVKTVYRVVLVTMLLYFTCWVPYMACRFLLTLAKVWDGWETIYKKTYNAAYVSLFLVYLKSALNPVLYVFAARNLSNAVRLSLVSMIKHLFSDSANLPEGGC